MNLCEPAFWITDWHGVPFFRQQGPLLLLRNPSAFSTGAALQTLALLPQKIKGHHHHQMITDLISHSSPMALFWERERETQILILLPRNPPPTPTLIHSLKPFVLMCPITISFSSSLFFLLSGLKGFLGLSLKLHMALLHYNDDDNETESKKREQSGKFQWERPCRVRKEVGGSKGLNCQRKRASKYSKACVFHWWWCSFCDKDNREIKSERVVCQDFLVCPNVYLLARASFLNVISQCVLR